MESEAYNSNLALQVIPTQTEAWGYLTYQLHMLIEVIQIVIQYVNDAP